MSAAGIAFSIHKNSTSAVYLFVARKVGAQKNSLKCRSEIKKKKGMGHKMLLGLKNPFNFKERTLHGHLDIKSQ